MLHFLACKSHWKHLILPAVLLCFQETCLQAEPSWCQCKTIHNKKDKKNLNHFTLKAYLCSTIHRFRVNIWDPWQACSVQSTYLSCSIWAWIWWSGRHPTWHHDKVNSIVCSTQGRLSLPHSVSRPILSINCGCSDDPNATVNTDSDKPRAHNQIEQICSEKSVWYICVFSSFSTNRDDCFSVLKIDFWEKNQT